jgi:hypothetical protein
MAVTLNLVFSDAEQARLDPAVQALLPGDNAATRKAKLEAEAKRILIERIKLLTRERRDDAARTSIAAEAAADDQALAVVLSPFDPPA